MKFVIGTIFFILAVFFNSIGSSPPSGSNPIAKSRWQPTPYDIYYYRDENNLLRPLPPNARLARNDGLIIGVLINNVLHLVYDRNHEAVVVRKSDGLIIPLSAPREFLEGFRNQNPEIPLQKGGAFPSALRKNV